MKLVVSRKNPKLSVMTLQLRELSQLCSLISHWAALVVELRFAFFFFFKAAVMIISLH